MANARVTSAGRAKVQSGRGASIPESNASSREAEWKLG
jgi:hypothetical protein